MSDNSTQPMYCYNHPQRETLLRCNRCERPICTACAVLTPTGYRCKECVRGQQKIFNTAQWWDFPLTVIVAGVLAFFGSMLTNLLGFFSILLAPVAGVVIAEAVRFVIRKRRDRLIPTLALIGTLAGGLISPLATIILLLFYSPENVLGSLFGLLWPAVFSVVAASSAYYRLKGIKI